jgi:hypothetical protein
MCCDAVPACGLAVAPKLARPTPSKAESATTPPHCIACVRRMAADRSPPGRLTPRPAGWRTTGAFTVFSSRRRLIGSCQSDGARPRAVNAARRPRAPGAVGSAVDLSSATRLQPTPRSESALCRLCLLAKTGCCPRTPLFRSPQPGPFPQDGTSPQGRHGCSKRHGTGRTGVYRGEGGGDTRRAPTARGFAVLSAASDRRCAGTASTGASA